jgi:hypothetical protein
VRCDDEKQGDGEGSNYLRGPMVFDGKSGKCHNFPGVVMCEIVIEEWNKAGATRRK